MALRLPMTPEEFDRKKRLLLIKFDKLSSTSGKRTILRSEKVGSSAASKHNYNMADDLSAQYHFETRGEHFAYLSMAAGYAVELGFWIEVHGKGNKLHLHIQGLPTGVIDQWWLEKFGDSLS